MNTGEFAILVMTVTALMTHLLAGESHAQSTAARAQALFEEAQRLWENDQIEAACEKLGASQEADPGVGTALHLSACREVVGQLAAAWAAAKAAEELAAARGDYRLEESNARVKALAPRLLRLRITVPPDARCEGLTVTRDGKPVPPAEWDTLLPIDPGPHKIMATALEREEWSFTLDLAGEGTDREISVPLLRPRKVIRPGLPPLASSPPQERLPSTEHDRQFGGFVRLDIGIDSARVGMSTVTGVTYGAGPGVELGLAAVLSQQPGAWAGANIYLLETSFKPFVTGGMHLLVVNDSVYPGAHGAAGLMWDPIRHVGVFAMAGVSYFPSVPGPSAQLVYNNLVFLPSVGVQGRL